jgi:hypothetical protein
MMILTGVATGLALFLTQEENKMMEQERAVTKRPVKGAVILGA